MATRPSDDALTSPATTPSDEDWLALAATAYCRRHHPTHSVTCGEAREAARAFLHFAALAAQPSEGENHA